MRVYLNGEFVAREEARVAVDDRGFLFGDGVYEVTRALAGRLFAEEAHWQRLERGLRELALGVPEGFGPAALRALSERLLRDNGLAGRDATVYLQVTRGAATPRAHVFPPAGTPPTVYAAVAPFEIPWPQRREGVVALTQPDLRWARCDLKTLNLLPNVLARQRAKEAGAWEALLVREGTLTEGAVSSALVVMDGALHAPPRDARILPGVTRDVVLGLARGLGLRVHEASELRLAERPRWQELLLTGTTTDVQPVVVLDGQPVGPGRPGPVCRALQVALYRHMGVALPADLAA